MQLSDWTHKAPNATWHTCFNMEVIYQNLYLTNYVTCSKLCLLLILLMTSETIFLMIICWRMQNAIIVIQGTFKFMKLQCYMIALFDNKKLQEVSHAYSLERFTFLNYWHVILIGLCSYRYDMWEARSLRLPGHCGHWFRVKGSSSLEFLCPWHIQNFSSDRGLWCINVFFFLKCHYYTNCLCDWSDANFSCFY